MPPKKGAAAAKRAAKAAAKAAVAVAVADVPFVPLAVVAFAVSETFNTAHFKMIAACKQEILAHDIFATIQDEMPLDITADAATSGRQVPFAYFS